jgi:ADP-heptose:LPS heptosyltransferase
MPESSPSRPERRYAFVDPRWLRLFATVDAVGSRLVPRRSRPIGNPTRVLIVNFAHLGDVVLATAAIRAVRAGRPRCHLAMLASPGPAALLRGHPALDQLHVFDAPWWGRGDARRHVDPVAIGRLASLIRSGRFDLVIQLKSFFQENLAAALARVPSRVGFGVYGGGFLQTHEVPYPWGAHTVEQNAALLSMCGITDPDPRLDLHPEPDDEQEARALVPDDGARLAALHLGAGTPAKTWLLERFVAVGERLAARGHTIVLVGGGDDAPLGARYAALATHHPIDVSGRLGPLATAALLRRCRIFVGADSAPAHMAAAMGTPTVAVFSGTNEAREWRPWGAEVEVLQRRPTCAPCGLAVCSRPQHDCMIEVTVDDVDHAVDRLLPPKAAHGGVN